MEIKFPKSECAFLRCACGGAQEQELTHELRLSDGMPDIGRVICARGQVILRGKEWRRDSISVSGGVMAWVMYIPEDGAQPRSVESWVPFQMKWDMEESPHDGDIRIQAALRFADARSISPRKIMLRMGVAAQAEAWVKDSADLYLPENIPEDIQLLTNTYPIRMCKASGEKSFSADEVLDWPDDHPFPEKLICYTMQPVVREKKIIGNKLLFRGTGRLHMVCTDEAGTVYSKNLEVPFSQYAEMEDVFSDAVESDIWMEITSLEVEMEQENRLRIRCGMLAQFLLDDRQMITVPEDAYSTTMDAVAQMEQLRIPSVLSKKQLTVDVKDTIRKDVGNIVDSVYLTGMPARRAEADQITWEVPIVFQTLYYDSSNMLHAANTRQLGQVSMAADISCESAVSGSTGGEATSEMGIDGAQINGQAMINIRILSGQGIPMVTGISLTSKKEENRAKPSLILRRAGEQSLWQMAKESGSTVEMIQKANGLTGEPEWDRILLIPVV